MIDRQALNDAMKLAARFADVEARLEDLDLDTNAILAHARAMVQMTDEVAGERGATERAELAVTQALVLGIIAGRREAAEAGIPAQPGRFRAGGGSAAEIGE